MTVRHAMASICLPARPSWRATRGRSPIGDFVSTEFNKIIANDLSGVTAAAAAAVLH